MGSFLERWNERYGQFTTLGVSDQRCQICHVSPAGGSTNGWNEYGWTVFELLESRAPFDASDLDYAYDFAGLENSDSDMSDSSNLTEIQNGFFPGWSAGSVNSIYTGSPTAAPVEEVNQPPPSGVPQALLDPPAKLTEFVSSPIRLGVSNTQLVARVSGLAWPRRLVKVPAEANTLLVVNLNGEITRLDVATGAATPFFNIVSSLPNGLLLETEFSIGSLELGLLNMVLAPDYAYSGVFYTFHTEPYVAQVIDFSTLGNGDDPHHVSVVTQWQILAMQGTQVTSALARRLVSFAHPQDNNTGGGLAFDTSDALLIGVGDGGGEGDQDQTIEFNSTSIPIQRGHGTGNAKDLRNPFGAVLRIDPDGSSGSNGNYGVPDDNPFIATVDKLDEIYAYGFRDPSEFVSNPEGQLYLSDTGEVALDEVNKLSPGQFFGWNTNEGDSAYWLNGLDPSYLSQRASLAEGEQLPLLQTSHETGKGLVLGEVFVGSGILAGVVSSQNVIIDGLLGFRKSSMIQQSTQLFGVIREANVAEAESELLSLYFESGDTGATFAVLHALQQLEDGRIFVAANTGLDHLGNSGVIYELTKRDDDLCFPVMSKQGSNGALICL